MYGIFIYIYHTNNINPLLISKSVIGMASVKPKIGFYKLQKPPPDPLHGFVGPGSP